MLYKSPPVGHELSCVMVGLDPKVLDNLSRLENLLTSALTKQGFNIKDIATQKFDPQGCYILIGLSESHASIHTYPEYGSMYFGIYSCRNNRDGWAVYEHLREELNPSGISSFSEKEVVVDQNHSALSSS